MDAFAARYLKVKAKLQTRQIMRKYRCKPWWDEGLSLWTESEMRLAWGDRLRIRERRRDGRCSGRRRTS